MEFCNICPRKCNVDRAVTTGYCGAPEGFKVARASLHHWEEPCISYKNGSGTIFFSGCNMGCVFCQNDSISHNSTGAVITRDRLIEIFYELKAQGAHNINLVTPTHYVKALSSVIEASPLPIVWNSSAYESVESLRLLENKVKIYLPDLKYSSDKTAIKYSRCPSYTETAKNAILEMYRQTGDYVIKNGLMEKGVIIRHLILPENLENTYGVIDWVASTFKKGAVLFSLLAQYTPYKTLPFSELNRRITKAEYIKARNYMLKKGITDGFVQELSSAKEEYTPAFDLTGV
jgi:putative pyruvate formate lyase activating enzyme